MVGWWLVMFKIRSSLFNVAERCSSRCMGGPSFKGSDCLHMTKLTEKTISNKNIRSCTFYFDIFFD